MARRRPHSHKKHRRVDERRGPAGGCLHSPEEYITVSSIVPRIAMLALLMLRRAQAE